MDVVQATLVQTPTGPMHMLFWHCQPAFEQVLPQLSDPPQPSPITPQYWSPEEVVQDNLVHTLGGPTQMLLVHCQPVVGHVVEQLSCPPQPSPITPQ